MPLTMPGAVAYLQAHRSDLRGLPPERVAAAYTEIIAREWTEMRPFLPAEAETVLDVGCGAGLLAAHLAARYSGAAVHLLDGDGPPTACSGWQEVGPTPSTSREVVEALFQAHGLPAPTWIDPHRPVALHADFVLSTLSWGFHYPLRVYPEITAHAALLDIRVGQEAEALARFGPPTRSIQEHPKYHRWLWNGP